MFENYVHTKEDLKAVEEALEYLERPELDFIFKDRNLIKNTLVISFDSQELFLWTKLRTGKLKKLPGNLRGWKAYRIPHEVIIKDEEQKGWSAGIKKKEFCELLPPKFQKSWYEVPKISGSLLAPFTKIHEKQRKTKFRSFDPYYTRESYLATIIHEFGHVYFNQFVFRQRAEKELPCVERAVLELYKSGKTDFRDEIDLGWASVNFLSETFAFCTDYTAASLFWPDHRADIDKENLQRMGDGSRMEKFSFLHGPHSFAHVFGRLLLERYPSEWPERLLKFS